MENSKTSQIKTEAVLRDLISSFEEMEILNLIDTFLQI